MSDEKALVPIEEQSVDFYGDEIPTALVDIDGRSCLYIPIKPISDYLGLAWSGQFERIQRDLVLSEVAAVIRLTRITATGGVPGSLCLPIEYLNGWLFGVNASRVKATLREKIVRYQRDCYRVLWEAFNTPSPIAINSTSTLEQIRTTALAVAQLAEQQMEMEQKFTQRLDKAAEVFVSFDRRLGTLEKKLSPAILITDEQAETISSTVKALAELITSKSGGKNNYQGIFSELYRRFGVSSYKNIRMDRYEQVLNFLENWRKSV
jgi:P22_AR N-terminal domain/ORF6C domain